MQLPKGYSVARYGEMIRDRERMTSYAEAIRRTVTPGSTVVDIGAGTGVFSLLACQAGAGQVHAIEPDPSIAVAREIAERNGFGDRVRFHPVPSTAVDLEERADVVVSDLRSVLPLFQHHIPSIRDARERLAKPGATLIPERDDLYVALAESEALYSWFADPWQENSFGLDMSPAARLVTSTWSRVSTNERVQLVEPVRWASLDYRTIDDASVSGGASWAPAPRSGMAHGLLVWFDTELCEGVGFSNAPGQPRTIYGQAFFPLERPVEIEAGDDVTVDLRADLVAGRYIWTWRTEVHRRGASDDTVRLQQSTFHASDMIGSGVVRRAAPGFVPTLAEDGEVDAFILGQMGQRLTLEAIATAAAARFAGRFSDLESALEHVAALSTRYSE